MRARDPSGFTLVEVLTVLGLLGLLMLATVPNLTVPGTLSASVMARQIAVDLRLARQLATSNRVCGGAVNCPGVIYSLEFLPAAGPYTSYTVRNESTLVEDPDFPKAIPSGLTVSGRQKFSFAPGGCLDDDLLTSNGCASTNGSVTVAAGADTATVQVFWYTGRVKVVQP